MARLRRNIQIKSPGVNLPERQNIGPAIVKTATTIGDIAQEKAESQALHKAYMASQAFQFDRDTNGMIVAPKLPIDAEGNRYPTIYESAYSEQLLQRYEQQIYLNSKKQLQEFALNNPYDPDAFDALADSYRTQVVESALPHIRGKINDELQALSLGHSNSIAAARAEWDHQRNVETYNARMESGLRDLASVALASPSSEQILAAYNDVLSIRMRGEETQLFPGGDFDTWQHDIEVMIAQNRLARRYTDVPADNVSESRAIHELNKFVDGEGTVEYLDLKTGNMEERPVADVFGTREERDFISKGIQSHLGSRLDTRRTWQDFSELAQVNMFVSTVLPDILDAAFHNKVYDTTVLERAMSMFPNNQHMQTTVGALLNRVSTNNQSVMDANDIALTLHFGYAGYGVIWDTMAPAIQEQVNAAFEKAGMADVEAWLNGTDLGFNDKRARYETFRSYFSMFTQEYSSGSLPEHVSDFLNAADIYQQRIDDFTRRWEANNGPLADADENTQRRYRIELGRSIKGLELKQTPKLAQYVDDIAKDRWSSDTWWELGAQDKETELRRRIDDIKMWGIIPQSLIDFSNDVLGNLDNYDAENRDFSQLLDVAQVIFGDPRLSHKGLTAFGERQTKALAAAVNMLGPSLRQGPTKQVIDLMNDAMMGKPIYTNLWEMEAEERDSIKEAMNTMFIDEWVEWVPYTDFIGMGDPGERSIFKEFFTPGDAIAIPKELQTLWEQRATTYGNLFDLRTESGRRQAFTQAYNDIRAEGWGVSEYALTSEVPKPVWWDPLTAAGVGNRRAMQTPSAVWAQNPLELMIPNTSERKKAVALVEKEIADSEAWKEIAGDAKPKMRENIHLQSIGVQERPDGVYEYAWVGWALMTDGTMVPINEDEGVNNQKMLFFSDGVEQATKERLRWEKKFDKNMENDMQRRIFNSATPERRLDIMNRQQFNPVGG